MGTRDTEGWVGPQGLCGEALFAQTSYGEVKKNFQSWVSVRFRQSHPAGLGGPGGDRAARGYLPGGLSLISLEQVAMFRDRGPELGGVTPACRARPRPVARKKADPETRVQGPRSRLAASSPACLVPGASLVGANRHPQQDGNDSGCWEGPGAGPGRVPTDLLSSPHQSCVPRGPSSSSS